MPNELEEFEEILRSFVRNATGTKRRVNKFYYNVFNYLSGFDFAKLDVSQEPRFLEILCPFLLERLLNSGCHDNDAVWKIMHVYKTWKCELMERAAIIDIPYPLAVYYIVKPLFVHDMRECADRFTDFVDMNIAFEIADITFTKALVKYGILQPFQVGSCFMHKDYRRLVSVGEHSYEGPAWALPDALHTLRSVKKYVQILRSQEREVDMFSLESDIVKQYNATSSKEFMRRITLVSYALRATLLKMRKDASSSDFVECLKLYHSAMPDPFVSGDEMRELVLFLFREDDYKEDVAAHFANDYASLFDPHVSTYLRPRSLQHLCRCALRKTLSSKRRTLPDMVDTLLAPTDIKNFLLGAPERRSY